MYYRNEPGCADLQRVPMSARVYFRAGKEAEAHLAGQVAAALKQKTPELLANAPKIEKIEILASKPAH